MKVKHIAIKLTLDEPLVHHFERVASTEGINLQTAIRHALIDNYLENYDDYKEINIDYKF